MRLIRNNVFYLPQYEYISNHLLSIQAEMYMDVQRYVEMDSREQAEKRFRKGLDVLAAACKYEVTHIKTNDINQSLLRSN